MEATKQNVSDYLKFAGRPLSNSQIAKSLGQPDKIDDVSIYTEELVTDGVVKKVESNYQWIDKPKSN